MESVILHCDHDQHQNEHVGDKLEALLEELEKHAAAVVRADRVADEHRKAIRELLPEARQAGAGPAELERTIKGIYVAGTISKWTRRPGSPRGRKKKPPARAADA